MVTPVKGMSTRAAQAERTRQQILDTAQRLFTELGYDATSLQMIADEMGLTKAAVDYLFRNRHYAVMASSDPAAKRDKLDAEAMTMRRRALTLLFGDNPTGGERLSFSAVFFIPECLPELTDLTDDELREALQTTMLRMLRVPSGSRE